MWGQSTALTGADATQGKLDFHRCPRAGGTIDGGMKGQLQFEPAWVCMCERVAVSVWVDA